MIDLARWFRRTFPLLAGLLLMSGCLPSGQGPSDEEKEPHFLSGKSCVSSMDYKGAVECFEKALEVNPKSASAHFELGWLYDQKVANPAAAIYHYQSYLDRVAQGPKSELAKTRIYACKQELARQVSLGPVTQPMQAEIEKISEENKRLKEELERWKAIANRPAPAATNVPIVSVPSSTPTYGANNSRVQTLPTHTDSPSGTRVSSEPAQVKRTHTVQAGETYALIAKRYGVRLDALMAANPRVNARKLKVGQVLNLP